MPGGSGTALSGYSNTVFAGGRTPVIREMRANGATFVGAIVGTDGETHPDVAEAVGDDADASAADATAFGVVMEDTTLDIDTDILDNATVRIGIFRAGSWFWVRLKASVGAITVGQKIYLADQEAGSAGVRQEPATPTVETNALNEKQFVGISMDVSADVAGNRWIRVAT